MPAPSSFGFGHESSRWRGNVAASIIAGHLVVLLTVLMQPAAAARFEPPAMALVNFAEPQTVAVALERPVAAAVPTDDVAVPDAPVLVMAPAPVDVAAVAAPVAGNADCAPAAALQTALAADAEVKLALSAVPATDRSVADAVVIWNTNWTPLAGASNALLATVRDRITRTLRELPTACLAQIVNGPRLVLIEASAGMMVLAFGSGTWRWQDVADTG